MSNIIYNEKKKNDKMKQEIEQNVNEINALKEENE